MAPVRSTGAISAELPQPNIMGSDAKLGAAKRNVYETECSSQFGLVRHRFEQQVLNQNQATACGGLEGDTFPQIVRAIRLPKKPVQFVQSGPLWHRGAYRHISGAAGRQHRNAGFVARGENRLSGVGLSEKSRDQKNEKRCKCFHLVSPNLIIHTEARLLRKQTKEEI